MNPLDNLLPPGEVYFTEDQEAEFHRHYRQARLRLAREDRERRRRKRMAALQALDAEVSSDSEVDGLSKDVKDGKMDLTPAGSTPQELVKLDP